jgi:hypothetical protein
MGAFMDRLFDPDNSTKIRDLADNHQEEEDRATRRSSQKKRNSKKDLMEDLAGLYNPTSYFLKSTTGDSITRRIGIGIVSNIVNIIRNFWAPKTKESSSRKKDLQKKKGKKRKV